MVLAEPGGAPRLTAHSAIQGCAGAGPDGLQHPAHTPLAEGDRPAPLHARALPAQSQTVTDREQFKIFG